MSVKMPSHVATDRRTVVGMTGINVPFLPLFANMVAVLSGAWPFGRFHNYQLALVVLLILVVALRTKLRLGIALNIAVVLAALIALFWSPEPLVYLAYSAFLLTAVAVLVGLTYILTRESQ